ncbi:hypothetical protein BCF46_3210 [Litoreibacter meonggei]|uniref:DUF2975 family protein n=1 Tax=Litoreibacter meonggei TaxID=1049199 RepID=A0A497VGR9_9RHOB|nr:hypothetical protein [Litoreibacter meonggei]RLJ41417.1 hypothetical protein BCF46_3210 [Litoreibacter meonggei]
MTGHISVARSARILSFLTMVLMIATVLGVTYFFIDIEAGHAVLLSSAPDLEDARALSDGTVRAMLCIGLVSVAVQLYLLWQARILFDLYASQNYLSRDCANTIRNLGFGLVALPVVRFLQEPIWSILMTLGSEDISVSIGVSSSGIGYLIGGVLMLLIGWAMLEASRAAEENKGFV